MRFTSEVTMFEFAGIPIVGCWQTGAVIGLTAEGAAVCERLRREDVPEGDIAAVDPALLHQLKLGGYFDGAEAGERVASAYLHVTQRCNLNCAGCYSLDDGRNALADASTEKMKAAVEGLASVGVSQLVISGGEPFLRRDLPEIVRHAKDCGIGKVTVLSNGTRLSSPALGELAPCVDCVSVSFDGCSASSPAYIRQEQRFDDLVEAVRAVQEAGIPAHIIPTVHAKNIEDLADYVALSKELGVTLNFSLLTCEPTDEVLGGLLPGDEELRALGRALLTLDGGRPIPAMDAPVGMNLTVKRNCGAGYRSLSVAADGTIYPCHMLHRPEFAMGNAFAANVAEALDGDVSRAFRALDAAGFDGCGCCEYLPLCGGGCRARSLYATGKLDAKDSYCAMTKAFYDALGATMAAAVAE